MSNRSNPRQRARAREAARSRAIESALSSGYNLPDPPENSDFLDLPEAFRDTISDRFARGIKLTLGRKKAAHRAYITQVREMHARRAAFARGRLADLAERMRQQRAGKASVDELAKAHDRSRA